MLIEEEEPKSAGDLNPDTLDAVFEDDVLEEEEVILFRADDEEADEIDIAFVEDEGYW